MKFRIVLIVGISLMLVGLMGWVVASAETHHQLSLNPMHTPQLNKTNNQNNNDRRPGDTFINIHNTYDTVSGRFEPNSSVLFTVTTESGSVKAIGAGTVGSNGWLAAVPAGTDIAPTDWVIVSTEAGETMQVQSILIEGSVDVKNDTIAGQMFDASFPANGNVYLSYRDQNLWKPISIAADGTYSVSVVGEFDLKGGVATSVYYHTNEGHEIGFAPPIPFVQINNHWNFVAGWYGANTSVAYTVTSQAGKIKAAGSGVAAPNGWFNSLPLTTDIVPTDWVTVATDNGHTVGAQSVPMSATVDAEADEASGQILDGVFPADGHIFMVRLFPNFNFLKPMSIDATGQFSVDLSVENLLAGEFVEVAYYTPDGDQIVDVFRTAHARAFTAPFYGVDGWFGIGATVNYTITDSAGNIEATMEKTAQDNGQLLFEWPGSTIDAGDKVEITSDRGYSGLLEMITIDGLIDVTADRVVGQMSGGDFPASGRFWARDPDDWSISWGGIYRIEDDGSYVIDLSGRFDFKPGYHIDVTYIDPNGNELGRVIQADHSIFLPMVIRPK